MEYCYTLWRVVELWLFSRGVSKDLVHMYAKIISTLKKNLLPLEGFLFDFQGRTSQCRHECTFGFRSYLITVANNFVTLIAACSNLKQNVSWQFSKNEEPLLILFPRLETHCYLFHNSSPPVWSHFLKGLSFILFLFGTQAENWSLNRGSKFFHANCD